jgi:ubiquinone biosynthesis protein UbiJ
MTAPATGLPLFGTRQLLHEVAAPAPKPRRYAESKADVEREMARGLTEGQAARVVKRRRENTSRAGSAGTNRRKVAEGVAAEMKYLRRMLASADPVAALRAEVDRLAGWLERNREDQT